MSEEHEDEHESQPPSAHHPSAPAHESFDISTTVDPSYVISLIRRLLPKDVEAGEHARRSGLIREEPKTESSRKQDAVNLPETGGEAEAMESSANYGEPNMPVSSMDDKNQGGSAVEETWEECGCVLWDLAASEDHAHFMVQNLVLDVLLANLLVSQSSRITEISLGIIGNLACHPISRKQIASTNGLVGALVEQLLLDDVPCLCEACRLLTLCLQGSEGVIWAEALQSEQILSRIFCIAENALNPQLLEKIVGLLLVVLESQQEVAAILSPPMLDLGLPSLLIKLLAFEMSTLKGERKPDRYTVLDLVLRAIETLSTMDDYSQQVCLNEELLQLVKELVELPDKYEVASSCVTGAVLIANILTEATNLASQLLQDLNFLQGLFDVFTFVSNDTEAQNAIWSSIARLLTLVKENEMSPSTLQFLVSILVRKLDLIEDELLVCSLEDAEKKGTHTSNTKTDARVIAMKRISNILNRWKLSDDSVKNTSSMEHCINEEDVDKLLDLLLQSLSRSGKGEVPRYGALVERESDCKMGHWLILFPE